MLDQKWLAINARCYAFFSATYLVHHPTVTRSKEGKEGKAGSISGGRLSPFDANNKQRACRRAFPFTCHFFVLLASSSHLVSCRLVWTVPISSASSSSPLIHRLWVGHVEEVGYHQPAARSLARSPTQSPSHIQRGASGWLVGWCRTQRSGLKQMERGDATRRNQSNLPTAGEQTTRPRS